MRQVATARIAGGLTRSAPPRPRLPRMSNNFTIECLGHKVNSAVLQPRYATPNWQDAQPEITVPTLLVAIGASEGGRERDTGSHHPRSRMMREITDLEVELVAGASGKGGGGKGGGGGHGKGGRRQTRQVGRRALRQRLRQGRQTEQGRQGPPQGLLLPLIDRPNDAGEGVRALPRPFCVVGAPWFGWCDRSRGSTRPGRVSARPV